MWSTHTALFLFLHMPRAAHQAHIFPALSNKSLISIGLLCNNGFNATFNTTSVSLSDGSTTICVNRDPKKGLYYLDMVSPPNLIPSPLPPLQYCTAYEMRTKSDLVHYLHRCDFIPVVTTWTKAIDAGYFNTYSCLTSELFRKHLPKSIANSKGHLQNIAKRFAPPNLLIPRQLFLMHPRFAPTKYFPKPSSSKEKFQPIKLAIFR